MKEEIGIIKVPEKKKLSDYPCIMMLTFGFEPIDLFDVESGNKVPSKWWSYQNGQVWLSPLMASGRKILGEPIDTVVNGHRNRTYPILGRVYAYDALADALSQFYPVTAQECRKMVENGVERGYKTCFFVLSSDLYPCSKEDFQRLGLENGWLVINALPDRKTMMEKLDQHLKEQNSSLRTENAFTTRLVLRK